MMKKKSVSIDIIGLDFCYLLTSLYSNRIHVGERDEYSDCNECNVYIGSGI